MIFISYRISDSIDQVIHLDRELTRLFGSDAVFRDKSRIKGGMAWPKVIEENAKSREVMLVVIGDTWQTAAFNDKARLGDLRLSDPEDWVRKEITLALKEGNVIIPLTLDNAEMPDAAWLAKRGLEGLPAQQAMKLRNDDYESDFASLVKRLREVCPSLPEKSTETTKQWTPAVLYPLQPAPHFQGRAELLAELTNWAIDPTSQMRVIALLAAGGTGKTAIAERVLDSLKNYRSAGVFVWSFYENPQTESFLREACRYFTGKEFKETGGLLERLQQALADERPHLLILDGLELVQATGTTGRPRGEIEDPLLKRLLRWLGTGLATRSKALITSRFPMPDLEGYLRRSFRECHLNDLEPDAAIALLRAWGVNGTNAALRKVLEPLQDAVTRSAHALSVSVLGSYLGKLWGGDPTKAPTFCRKDYSATDPKAAKLSRILASYARKLPRSDRDLLSRLSLYPRGVTVEILGYLVDAGGDVAGRLLGCEQAKLLQMLEGLRDLGLVFRFETSDELIFSAHPFLRAFFETLLDIENPTKLHEAVRIHLAPTLSERPSKKPTDPKDLDRYEQLIEVTRLSGLINKAFDLFFFGLGGYEHLGKVLGESIRGHRIVSSFTNGGGPTSKSIGLHGFRKALLMGAWGLFAENLGDLPTARQAFEVQLRIRHRLRSDSKSLSIAWQNIADAELLAGRWVAVQHASESAISHAEQAGDKEHERFSNLYRAFAFLGQGRLADARKVLFSTAVEPSSEPRLLHLEGVLDSDFKLASGRRKSARDQTFLNKVVCGREKMIDVCARCDTVLGRCALPKDSSQALLHLLSARSSASHTGNIDVTLRCYHLAAEIARHDCDFTLAVAESTNGIQLADSCGFGRWSIDIRLELTKIHLAAGKPGEAIEPAAKALEMSEHPDCQYAWGIADGLHLLGVAHARLGDKPKARDYLRRAVEKRRPLEHPGLTESKTELRGVE